MAEDEKNPMAMGKRKRGRNRSESFRNRSGMIRNNSGGLPPKRKKKIKRREEDSCAEHRQRLHAEGSFPPILEKALGGLFIYAILARK